MSWLKFNDSISAIKGQITNFAQEVLTEIPSQDEDTVRTLENANERIDQLTNLCATQDNEIASLRKQIVELQQKNAEPTATLKPEQNAGLEDSWFWEPDNNTSSSSSKNDNEIISKSTSGGDLTIIPLDHPVGDGEIVEKLRNRLIDYEKKLEKTNLENAVLNEKLTQISNENKELNLNIEELDKQHNMAIEEVLMAKNNLQDAINELKVEYLNTKRDLEQLKETNKVLDDELRETRVNYQNFEKVLLQRNEDHETTDKILLDVKQELLRTISQNEELTVLLESKEEILKGLENLRNDNLVSEQQFIELQNKNGSLQSEMIELKSQLETSNDVSKILNEAEQKNQMLEDELTKLNELNRTLKLKLDKSELNYRELLLEKETELEEFKNLLEKSEKSEKNLQNQIIDLQSSLNNKKIEVISQPQGDSSVDIKEIIQQYSDFKSNIEDEQLYLEEYLKSISDIQSQKIAIEKELQIVNEEKENILHQKETLQADLIHYEIECSELMKNNEILLTEIDNLKCGKLETIHENNEDSIIILEQQLEDCSNLNRSLEDEYMEVQQKLETTEAEKLNISNKLELLKKELEDKNTQFKKLKNQIESLETEKINLVFEINELKTDDYKSLHENEIQNYKQKINSQEIEIESLKKENSEFHQKLDDYEKQLIHDINVKDETIKLQQNEIEEKCNKLLEQQAASKQLASEIEIMKLSLDERKEECDKINKSKQEIEELIQKYEEEINILKIAKQEYDIRLKTLENSCKENKIRDVTSLEEIKKLNEIIADLQKKILESTDVEEASNQHISYQENIDFLNKEKNDLIALVTVKHNESLQYHAEVQRLSQVLHLEVEKTNSLKKEIEIIKSQYNDEKEKFVDQINFLREKSDILTKNLLAEQTNQKLLNQEIMDLTDQKTSLSRDLERLRLHLIEVEDAHTQETVELQKTIEDSKHKISFLEEEVKKSSTAYTSASIRANQHTETLQAQYLILTQQKDDLATKLSQAEDRESKNQAALINLQCALEQFQRDKERDIETSTSKLRNEIQNCKRNEKELHSEIQNLQYQLTETKTGLLAASRISDQLEMSQITITTLKNELQKAQDKHFNLENKLHDVETNHADKVEKTLVKNLLIGYIVSSNNIDKLQILKLISSVLDFNQIESDKVGLNKSHGSWLNSIISSSGPSQSGNEYNKEGLAQAFVKFLERESQPRITANDMPTLLNIRRPSQSLPQPIVPAANENTGTTSVISNPQQVAVQPILLNESYLTNFVPARNSSTILKEILNDS